MALASSIPSAIAVLCCLSAPAWPAGGVLEELKDESVQNGLALVAAARDRYVIIPFDGPVKYLDNSVPFQFETFTVDPDGNAVSRQILASDGPPLISPRRHEFLVERIDGTAILRVQQSLNGSVQAINAEHKRIAFSSRDRSNGISTISWASFDAPNATKTVDQSAVGFESVAWSPDGTKLVYGKGQGIFLFDTVAEKILKLADGFDPTWRPDGQCVALRSVDGRALLVNLDGRSQDWAMANRRILGTIRWSPDGLFVSYLEPTEIAIPFLTSYSRLMVARLRDGEATKVRSFGAGSEYSDSFHWILHYRSFCTTCKPGQPFN